LSRIHEITKIDMWFLKQYEELYTLEKEISTYKVDTLPKELYWKRNKKVLPTDKLHMVRS
jgi:carbamoyl-phosphate synthase large subunit